MVGFPAFGISTAMAISGTVTTIRWTTSGMTTTPWSAPRDYLLLAPLFTVAEFVLSVAFATLPAFSLSPLAEKIARQTFYYPEL